VTVPTDASAPPPASRLLNAIEVYWREWSSMTNATWTVPVQAGT
jgi:hypothetical protein